jgi:hypothetical protein
VLEVFFGSVDATDGEEFTNEIPGFLWGAGRKRESRQMCPDSADFKHFRAAKIEDCQD